MGLRRWRIRLRAIRRRLLGSQDSGSRIARGVAAGFFVTALPLPGLQIPLSVLLAWAVRGNKGVALLPQFLSNAATMPMLAFLEHHIGVWLWPSRGLAAQQGLQEIGAAMSRWSWTAPIGSVKVCLEALRSAGWDILLPLAIGALVLGGVLAIASYSATVVAVWAWRTARRRRRLRRGFRPAPPAPLVLPGVELPPPTCAEALLRYAISPERFTTAHAVKLLVDGREAYPEMLYAIGAARESVDLETYILRADRVGAKFQQALIEAAQRKVRVRLLYDYVGSYGLPDRYVRSLIEAGVSVSVYRPLILTRPSWSYTRRCHRKILLVDGQVAFTGGLNIADDYAAPEDGGGGWRDTHVRLDGESVAARLAELFEYDWESATPYAETSTRRARLESRMLRRLEKPIELPWRHTEEVIPAVCAAGGVPVQIIGNEEFRYRRRIRRAYLHAVRHAQRYILIENAYFIPDRGVRRALARAARRGVLVAVAVAKNSDVPIATYASRNLYSELLASGVRIFEWPLSMLHAKTAVVDDAWAIVGSYNFDHRSLFHQLEAVAVVADAGFARRLRDQTLADLARCHEVTRDEHDTRPWSRMLLESAAYQLRYWL